MLDMQVTCSREHVRYSAFCLVTSDKASYIKQHSLIYAAGHSAYTAARSYSREHN